MSSIADERRFIFTAPIRDMDEFKAFAAQAARLKPYGQVLLDVATLAEKANHEMPEQWSAWHDYAIFNPALHKVFPHPKIAPFVPADYTRKNRDLLLEKTAVVRELGIGAWMLGQEPYFMPEAFFEKYPHLRGPRIDHPRRSRTEEFAMCTDLDEVREIYEWEMAELKRNCPELQMFMYNTNDAGSGFCWAEALYSGPNGPRPCRGKTAGQRVREFFETLHRGAKAGGGDVAVWIAHVNFWRNELPDVLANLPENSGIRGFDHATMGVGSQLNVNNLTRGFLNPLEIISGMEKVVETNTVNVLVGLGAVYHRTAENPETVGKIMEIIADCLERPVKGVVARISRLHEIALRWAGEDKAGEVAEALFNLDQLLKAKQLVVKKYSVMYCGISMRHITRPLLFDTECLTPEEEEYFLPHVFNIRESEARYDYIDSHGGRMRIAPEGSQGIAAVGQILSGLRTVAEVLEDAKDGPEGEWLFRMGTSVRIYASALRSIDNFYFGQLIRDRSAEALAADSPRIPEKVGSWDGEGEILAWNARMRNEFDNTNELIALLEERGLDQLAHTDKEDWEDTFILGPEIIDQLKKKVSIMRDHWLDVEKYLGPPHK